MPSFSDILTVSAVVAASVTTAKPCPPLGAVLPAPKAPSKHDATPKAANILSAGLEDMTSGYNTSAVSIGVKSLHEDRQLFSYHHTPPVSSGFGTDEVDENTIYRVGSVSKMFAALAALQNENIDMDASVLKYIPELGNATSNNGAIANVWEDITPRSLANHLSGLATDMATDMAIFPSDVWTEMGLPEIPKGEGPSCSGLPPTEPCTKKDLIENIADMPPVFLPQASPSYSNTAYAVLGMVVEAATGKSFNDVVKNSIYDVAGMESSSFDGFVDSFSENGFVPPQELTWNQTLGVFEAAGGMFSNTVDMIAFLEALQKDKLLSTSKTQQWMKPQTHTSSAYFSIGEGWEIVRSDNLTTDGRLVEVYTKSGDLGQYHALIGIVPDYDISISVLTGGAEVSSSSFISSGFFSAVIKALLPAIEAAGRDEASRFEGMYSDEETNSTLILSSDDGPGLVIEEFQVRGFDVLHNFDSYNVQAAEGDGRGQQPTELPPVDGRLYPTKRQGRGAEDTSETAWRAVIDSTTEEDKIALQSQLFWPDASCVSWIMLDRSRYNYLSLSDFGIVENRAGGVKEIRNRAFNVTLNRVSGNNYQENDSGDGFETVPEAAAEKGKMISSSATFIVSILMALQLL